MRSRAARRLMVDPLLDEISPDDFRAAISWGDEATARLILERGLAVEATVDTASAG